MRESSADENRKSVRQVIMSSKAGSNFVSLTTRAFIVTETRDPSIKFCHEKAKPVVYIEEWNGIEHSDTG